MTSVTNSIMLNIILLIMNSITAHIILLIINSIMAYVILLIMGSYTLHHYKLYNQFTTSI